MFVIICVFTLVGQSDAAISLTLIDYADGITLVEALFALIGVALLSLWAGRKMIKIMNRS